MSAAQLRSEERVGRPRPPAPIDLLVPPGLRASPFKLHADEFLVMSFEGARGRAPAELTRIQRQIVDAVVAGRSNAQIARDRGRSPRTVANQLAAIYRKLHIRSRLELIAACAGTR